MHHIFPKNYLANIGITEDRRRNQVANYTFLDYQTNIDISDDAPQIYAAKYRTKLGDTAYEISLAQNAIPENFENMDYEEFLATRRSLMSKLIRKAYKYLSQD